MSVCFPLTHVYVLRDAETTHSHRTHMQHKQRFGMPYRDDYFLVAGAVGQGGDCKLGEARRGKDPDKLSGAAPQHELLQQCRLDLYGGATLDTVPFGT